MSKKKNNQDIVNSVVKLSDEHSHSVNQFMQALQESIIEGLQTDGSVEIDGFGTFSTLRVASREGVNISNGEKITVPEFTKFSFSPKFSSLSKSNGNENDSFEAEQEDAESENESPVNDASGRNETLTEDDIIVEQPGELNDNEDDTNMLTEEQDAEPVKEKPADHFSGIDVLISTPESLEETRERLAAAKEREQNMEEMVRKAQAALEQAKQTLEQSQASLLEAQEDVRELAQTINNVDRNRKALIDNGAEEAVGVQETRDSDITVSTVVADEKPIKQNESTKNNGEADDNKAKQPKRKTLLFIAAAAVACLAIVLLSVLFCSKSSSDNKSADLGQKKENVATAKQHKTIENQANGVGTTPADSLVSDSAAKALSGKRQLTATTVTRVDTVVFDGTEYLEHIVTNHYGEHDMVYKVIQFNRKHGLLQDLNHIPIGSNILLPHYE